MNIEYGRHTYGKPKIRTWGEGGKVTVGAFCSISDYATFYLGGNHRTDWISTYPFCSFSDKFPGAECISGHPASKGEIRVGNDVWIADGAVIMSGSIIGDGCSIGANTIIAGAFDPYSIIVGNPAHTVRKRFQEQQIKALLEIKWWEWDDEKITENLPLLMSRDIDKFIKKHRKV